jgi:putative transposase
VSERRGLIEPDHPDIGVRRQCELVGLPRSTWYFEPATETEENLALMRVLDELYTKLPFYGVLRMTAQLRKDGHQVNPKRVRRLLRLMALEALYPKRALTTPAPGHRKYPYLLRGLPIARPHHVWSSDITYIRMRGGFLYLVAVVDWFSRFVLSWELSNTMDVHFCLSAFERALKYGSPEIWNSDQGSQYTCDQMTTRVEATGARISMDGRGRALDNVFTERVWWSVKYEEVYLRDYQTVADAIAGLTRYFNFYNNERLHQALNYQTPALFLAAGRG